MTTPAQPDTGAGAAPETGSAPATPTDPQPDTSATDTDWQAEAEKFKAIARKQEERAKASKKALDEATAAKAGEPTLEDLQKRAEAANQRAEQAEAKAKAMAYKDAVRTVATPANLDVEALLDSDSFRREVYGDLGDDYDDDDLKAAVTKATKVFAKKPRFTATGTASPRGGADIQGGPTPPAKARPSSLAEAFRRRDGA